MLITNKVGIVKDVSDEKAKALIATEQWVAFEAKKAVKKETTKEAGAKAKK